MPARACRVHEPGPADLAASRRMKTTRAGGGHPDHVVAPTDPANPGSPTPTAAGFMALHQRPRWWTLASVGALPFYGPFGDIADQPP